MNFAGVVLKKAEGTKIKSGFGVKATMSNAKAVLVISRSWKSVYEWVSDQVKLVLITTTSIRRTFDFIDSQSYAQVISFDDLNSAIVDWTVEELHKTHNFTAIVCLGEEDLIRCGRLRKRLGIENTGQTTESALFYRDKVLMKESLVKNNVLVPVFQRVEDSISVIEFISIHGLPVVIKPSRGYGSVNTTIIFSEADLKEFLNRFTPQLDSPLGLEIEKFIEGPMYHIDGVYYNNKLSICWPSCYLNFCGDFKKEKFNASYSLDPSNPLVERLQKYILSVIETLGGPFLFPFHAEVWHTPDDKLVLCEIASRVGGAGIRHVMEAQFGVLLDKVWVQSQCHDPMSYSELDQPYTSKIPKHKSSGWIIIFPENGKLLERPEKEEGEALDYVIKYFPISSPGSVHKEATHSADAIAQFIVKGSSEEEALFIYSWGSVLQLWSVILKSMVL